MKNKSEIIIRVAMAVCVAVLFLQGYGAQNGGNAYAIAYQDGGPEGGGGGFSCWHNPYGGMDVCTGYADGGGGWGGGGGGQPPPAIWQQEPPIDGIYSGHQPDKDGLIQPGNLVDDLCKWIFGYHCSSVGSDYTMKQDWTEDPQSNEMYDSNTDSSKDQIQNNLKDVGTVAY